MDKITLDSLILLSKDNNTQAFRQIVETYQSNVYSLAFKIVNDEHDAKDIVQETFIKTWLTLKSYNSDKKFINWILSIATNLCIDKIRSSKIREYESLDILESFITNENAEQKMIDEEFGHFVSALTQELSPKQKIVFTLHCLEGMSTKEIEEITGLNSKKIKSNLFLARKIIRIKLSNYEK